MFFRRGSQVSLRHRVMASVLAVAVVIIGLAGAIHGLLLEHLADNFLRQRLKTEADYLSAPFIEHPLYRRGNLLASALLAPDNHHIFAIYEQGAPLLPKDPWNQALAPVLKAPAGRLRKIRADDKDLIAYRRHFRVGGWPFDLVVAENVDQINRDVSALHWWVAGVSFLLLVLLVVMLLAAIRLAFRPVVRLGGQLSGLQGGELLRLEPQGAREVDELGDQINQLLDTMDQRLERSRMALANLSHSLKTPLTALLGILESDHPIEPETRRILIERLRGIHQQVEDELRRARLVGPSVGAQCLPVSQARALVRLCTQLYADKAIESRFRVSERQTLPVERQDFNEMLGNVLDNACKWSRSRVTLSISLAGTTFVLRVEDDGPGVPESQIQSLGHRGLRLDEQTPGHGLGLAIVRDVVSRYQGHLILGSSTTLGGFAAEISLPIKRVQSKETS